MALGAARLAQQFQRLRRQAKKPELAPSELTALRLLSGADRIDFLCVKTDDRLVIRFSDNGSSFDPVNNEAQEKEFEELDTGGMGIVLVKQITEKLTYRRIKDKNILRMVFKL